VHTVGVHKAVTADRLAEVITSALAGSGVKAVVEAEEEWAAIERELAEEDMDERPRASSTGTGLD
jgi:hypothetical protein